MKSFLRKSAGEITVFLSLILLLMMGFLMSLTQSAWIQMSKGEARSLSEMAMESVFGEYRKEALECYELFLLDGGYRTGNYSEEGVLRHYLHYINECLHVDGGGEYGIGAANPVHWSLAPEDMKLSALQIATDSKGQAIREQISNYMQMHTGLELLQKLTGQGESMIRDSEKVERDRQQYAEESAQNTQILEELEDRWEDGDGEVSSGEEYKEFLREVKRAQSSGILSVVLPSDRALSSNTIELSSAPSHRKNRTGYGEQVWKTGRTELLDRTLFYAYAVEQLSSYVGQNDSDLHPAEEHRLEYELEYLLMGRGSDAQNLEAVVKRLLLIREGVNFAYLMTDGAKQAEAEALATMLTGAAGLPILIEAVKWSLLLAWAYGESILDLRALMSGKKLAVVKTGQNWKLQLSDLANIGSVSDSEGDGGGLDYIQWLMLLMVLGNVETHTMRLCDIVEANIRELQGNNSFRIDDCISGMTVENTWSMGRGITYSYPISYGYR